MMVDNSRSTRIFYALQKARQKGVLESDLFNNDELSGNIRVIKHRVSLNKMLGTDAVKVVNGMWYLASEHWDITRLEFNALLNRSDLIHMQHKNNMLMLAVVSVFGLLIVIASFMFYNLGAPNTLEECGFIFGYESYIYD